MSMAAASPPEPLEDLTLETRGSVALITLNRPDKLNAWTAAMERSMRIAMAAAAVQGDNVLDVLSPDAFVIDEANCTLGEFKKEVISANAYLGAGGIVDALKAGADVVLTGRAADPAMFLAPQIFEFGWQMDDWTRLGRGTLVGHLLECGGQVTGGYFADPGLKDVPDLANLGFPIAEVDEDGNAIITKLPGTGGFVNAATCKEQLLYEVHDPKRYIQPDVIADFSAVQISEVGPDRVAVSNGDGLPKTGSLKVSIGYIDSCVGEGQISYAGPGATARGQLALDILQQRIEQNQKRGVASAIFLSDSTAALRFKDAAVIAMDRGAVSKRLRERYQPHGDLLLIKAAQLLRDAPVDAHERLLNTFIHNGGFGFNLMGGILYWNPRSFVEALFDKWQAVEKTASAA